LYSNHLDFLPDGAKHYQSRACTLSLLLFGYKGVFVQLKKCQMQFIRAPKREGTEALSHYITQNFIYSMKYPSFNYHKRYVILFSKTEKSWSKKTINVLSFLYARSWSHFIEISVEVLVMKLCFSFHEYYYMCGTEEYIYVKV
jgi:hypothetical protein